MGLGISMKRSNIKAEGYEVMMDILKDEYGIDLSKKVEAKQSKNSRSATQKSCFRHPTRSKKNSLLIISG